jgi:hypothetical protein
LLSARASPSQKSEANFLAQGNEKLSLFPGEDKTRKVFFKDYFCKLLSCHSFHFPWGGENVKFILSRLIKPFASAAASRIRKKVFRLPSMCKPESHRIHGERISLSSPGKQAAHSGENK